MEKINCLVIHEGTEGSDVAPFEYLCTFTHMSTDIEYIYIHEVDRCMRVTKIAACGTRSAQPNIPDFLVYIEDGDHLDALLQAEIEGVQFEIAAEEVENYEDEDSS